VMTRYWRSRSKTISESFDAIRELTLLNAQGIAVADVAADSRGVARATASTAAISVSPRYLLECVVVIVIVLAALQVYGRTDGDAWMTQLAFLSFAAYRMLPALQQIFAGVARIRAEYGVFSDIAAILSERRSDTREGSAAAVDSRWQGRPRNEIELVDVSYRHSSTRVGGVENVSVRLPAGSIVGVVGPSGSGKTTLAELILGLLIPDNGQILIDGVPLERNNRRSWFTTIAYVPQKIILAHGTIAQNIAFGIEADGIESDRLNEAIDKAQLRTLVDGLPNGLATDIGEDGVQLSGGERQRVGIARALYRRASLLVLDESTNALDAASEAQILELIADLRGECTTIIISHHARTVSGCEMLVRLDDGRLAAAESTGGKGTAFDTFTPKHRAGT
ncbi:MAG TPA: ATP-binding cassette domain-containing protein, partial [Gammaproteobacteria bacterium]|nr:ATP-binding cassette domain-containing protein [Gammaproteobacteria bacterium]